MDNLFSACSKSNSLEIGKRLHRELIESQMEMNTQLQNTLIHMYSECGSLGDAISVFNQMNERDIDVITWSTMMNALGSNGRIEETLNLFDRMK